MCAARCAAFGMGKQTGIPIARTNEKEALSLSLFL